MEFIATYWWIWLVLLIVFCCIALKILIWDMTAVTIDSDAFISEAKKLIIPGGIIAISFILLVIGVWDEIFGQLGG